MRSPSPATIPHPQLRRRLRRAAAGLGVIVVLPLAAGACGSSTSKTTAPSSTSSTKAVSSIHITIQNFAFHPADFTVTPGATITVTNKDTVTHTLTDMANAKLFNTGDVNPGKTVTIKAPTKAGTYPYFCRIHNYMLGTMKVS